MLIPEGELPHLLQLYGYGAIGGIVALECLGLPLPGETVLVAAAVVAGTNHLLNIWFVIAAAAAGAVFGSSGGLWLGREFGYWLLVRHGRYVRMTEQRIKVGQYLFLSYGGTVVFVGRFIPVLRSLAGLLAGANRMGWPRFSVFNAAGAIVWAVLYGLAAYFLGKQVSRLAEPFGIAVGVIAVIAIFGATWFLRRHEAELAKRAEAALPGPLQPPHRYRQK